MTKQEFKQLKDVLSHLRMDRASFSSIAPSLDPAEMALPKTEQEVDRFIKARTRLYMTSWCIAPLQEVLAKYEKTWKRAA
jgi:hypothetical protein